VIETKTLRRAGVALSSVSLAAFVGLIVWYARIGGHKNAIAYCAVMAAAQVWLIRFWLRNARDEPL
jgi:hypothetical protein